MFILRTMIIHCFILTIVSAAAMKPRYAIRLFRASHRGQRYQVTHQAQYRLLRLVQMGARIQKSLISFGVLLKADVVVLAVAPDGRALHKNFRIKQCLRIAPQQREQILPPGSSLDVKLVNDQEVFWHNNKPVTSKIAKLLELVIQLDKKETLPDQLYGTNEPRAVGESWQPNLQASLKALRQKKLPKPDKLNGTVQLTGIKEIDGIPCLHIQSKVLMCQEEKQGKRPIRRLSLYIRGEGDFPVDITRPAPWMSYRTVIDLAYRVPSTGILVNQKIVQTRHSRYVFAPNSADQQPKKQ